MQSLAAWIMAARWQAVTAVVGFAALGLVIQPAALLSGAALVLVTLRLGAADGLRVLALSVLALALLSLVGTGAPWLGLSYGLVQWAPLMALALVLRATVSVATTLQVATGLALAAVFAAHAFIADLRSAWAGLLDEYLRPLLTRLELSASGIDAYLAELARVMTGALAASMLLSVILALLLGRWWQAVLYNPGGFRGELTALNLGPIAGVAMLALMAGALATKAPLVIEVALVVSVAFCLQGLAIVHVLSGRAKSPLTWLVAAYALLALALPQMAAGLAALGAIDTLADFRGRLGGTRHK